MMSEFLMKSKEQEWKVGLFEFSSLTARSHLNSELVHEQGTLIVSRRDNDQRMMWCS